MRQKLRQRRHVADTAMNLSTHKSALKNNCNPFSDMLTSSWGQKERKIIDNYANRFSRAGELGNGMADRPDSPLASPMF